MRNRIVRVLRALPVLPVLAAAPAAHAGVVYVNGNARGTVHDGTSWKTAYTTVSDALAAASRSSSEVWVAQGIYYENLHVPSGYELYGGFLGKESNRSQRNPAANQTVLRGSGANDVVITCTTPGVVVDGFLIQAGTTGIYVDGSAATATVADNEINAQLWGVTVGDAGTATLIGNRIIRGMSMGVNIGSNCSATLTSNTIAANGGDGVDVAGAATLSDNAIFGNAVGVEVSGAGVLTGNTITGNRYGGVAAVLGTTQMINNLVAFNQGGGIIKSPDGVIPVPSHNDVYGNTPTEYDGLTPPAGEGNISADPLFVDLAHWDLHLQAGSPCVDAGFDAAVLNGETDRDGNPRLAGAHVDIGCYEAAFAPYSVADAARALAIGCGAFAATPGDVSRLNVEPGAAIDLHDAVRLVRKAVHLDANP